MDMETKSGIIKALKTRDAYGFIKQGGVKQCHMDA